MIQIGDKVVCVRPPMPAEVDWNDKTAPCGLPVKGDVYAVDGLGIDIDGELFLKLVGKPVFSIQRGDDCGYCASRFRKLEDYRNEQELAYYRGEPLRAQPVEQQ